jgi:hypothetical protein
MSHFNFTKRASKTTDRQKMVHKTDALLSEYVRLRDSDDKGMVTCMTCGDRVHWTDAQCGHYVKRGNAATRYNLKNCAAQCSTCNCAKDGCEEDHGHYIDLTYGVGTADELERLGKTERHYSEHELKAMCDELKAEIKALKIEKGMI